MTVETNTTDEPAEPQTKVWICPGCGARYNKPTTCTNEHEPLEAQEYDLAPAEAAVHAADDEAPAAHTTTEAAESETATEPVSTLDTAAAFDAASQAHSAVAAAKQALDDAHAQLDALLAKLGVA